MIESVTPYCKDSMSVSTPIMTAEDLLAMPDDGIERELVRGVLRGREMAKRILGKSIQTSKPCVFIGETTNR